MTGVNKAILLGNLGKDPEIRYTPQGAAVCTFQIATSRTWKGKDNDRKEETEWHTVICFNKLAESCAEYIRKGSKVFVEGRIKTEKWEKGGTTHYRTRIVAESVVFLDARKDGTGAGNKDKEEDVPF